MSGPPPASTVPKPAPVVRHHWGLLGFLFILAYWATLYIGLVFFAEAGILPGQLGFLTAGWRPPPEDFSTITVCHTIAAGLLAWLAVRARAVSAMWAANLVRLIGYLYMLAGLVLAFRAAASVSLQDPTAAVSMWNKMLPGIGGAVYTSLVGWFMAGWIDRDEPDQAQQAQVQLEGIKLDLSAQAATQLHAHLATLASAVAKVATAAEGVQEQLAAHTKLLKDVNELVSAVNDMVTTDAKRREGEEKMRHEILQRLPPRYHKA